MVTVITAWAYGSAIEFNKAYMDYFNCGIYYEMQLWVIYDIVIIILPCFITFFFTYYIFKDLPVKLLAIILLISLMIGFFPDNFWGWFLYLLK